MPRDSSGSIPTALGQFKAGESLEIPDLPFMMLYVDMTDSLQFGHRFEHIGAPFVVRLASWSDLVPCSS